MDNDNASTAKGYPVHAEHINNRLKLAEISRGFIRKEYTRLRLKFSSWKMKQYYLVRFCLFKENELY